MEGLVTRDWGVGLFKYLACDLCDDVVGETADVSFGDAWLDMYRADPKGTNVLVVRNRRVIEVLQEAMRSGEIKLESLSSAKVVESQESGFRHRRPGLAYRLWTRQQAGKWSPRKRVEPDEQALPPRRRRAMDRRVAIAEACRPAFLIAKQRGSFQLFIEAISPLIAEYRHEARGPLVRRMKRKVIRMIRAILCLRR
jgi:hypothetical protein